MGFATVEGQILFIMARLEGKVEELSQCRPGDRLAVWYSDDVMYHERILVWKTGEASWYILTPDKDLYEEIYDDPANGPHHFKIKGVHYQFNSRLRSPIYSFTQDPTEEDMKGFIFQALDGMGKAQLGPGDWLPPSVKVGKKEVSTTLLLGTRAVPRRVTRGGGQIERPIGLLDVTKGFEPELLNEFLPMGPAPEGHVWLHLPCQHESFTAEEIQVVRGLGVTAGPTCGLYFHKGAFIPLKLVRVEDAPTIMEHYLPKIDRQALRRDLGVGEEETGSSPKKAGSAAELEETGNPDARVMEVDYDAQGERYKEWRQVAIEAKEYSFQDWPLDGPLTTRHLIKHFSKFGGDPKRWLADWMRAKQIQENDRITFEMKVLIECLYLAGTYDQLNLSCLASIEVISRRVQAVVDAYSTGTIPDWGSAKIMTLYRAPEDAISPQLRSWAARKNKEELEIAQSRAKYRESKKGLYVEEASASAAADGALPGAAKAKAKTKGRGRGLEAPSGQ